MRKSKRLKRDLLILKLAKDGNNYPDISVLLVGRGYDELRPDTIGMIVRRMNQINK